MFYSDYKQLLMRFFLSLFLFVILRLAFYFFNFNYFEEFSLLDTSWAFIYGLRFDLAAALMTNLFFILFSLVPLRNNLYESFLKFLFISFNFVFLGVCVVDLEFFSFLGKKMTYDIFSISGDISDQSLQLILNYWHLSLIGMTLLIVLFKMYPESRVYPLLTGQRKTKWYMSITLGTTIFILTAIGVRGGVQLRSLSPKDAFRHEHYELGNLSLNAVYTMVRSFGNKGSVRKAYFKTDSDAVSLLRPLSVQRQDKIWHLNNKQNVVIIIVESLSQEYIDKGLTPFLSKLFKKGLYFSNNFANGRRSIEALPSILTGFPSLLEKPLYQSQYQTNKYHGLPQILKTHGYSTSFFHGGKRGTMDFDSYCYSIGVDQYFALEDYPTKEHYDGAWGVYDHHYLNYVVDQLSKESGVFLSTIFTLSSHQPYKIPDNFRGRFDKGSLEIHESIGYADYSLEKFFEKAKTTKWYKETLFVITADHTQKLESRKFKNTLGRYRVPLFFFHPQQDLTKFDNAKVTQHVDILPSILNFLGIGQKERLLFGESIFLPGKGKALNAINGQFFYLKANKFIQYDESSASQFSLGKSSEGELVKDSVVQQELIRELQAYIQYTFNGLRDNSIYIRGE